jgi:hypothetical protein
MGERDGGKLHLYVEGKPEASSGDPPCGRVEMGWREARASLWLPLCVEMELASISFPLAPSRFLYMIAVRLYLGFCPRLIWSKCYAISRRHRTGA